MAGEELGERKHGSVKDFCNDHVKTIVTLVMIFGTILCIVLIVMVHKWRYESEMEAKVHACLDVAVIGAGMSGSYATWRLRHELPTGSKIQLFEMSNRVGGRLYSRGFPDFFEGTGEESGREEEEEEEEEEDEDETAEYLRADMGGLYYLPQWHPRLNRSIHALNLKPVELHPPSRDLPTLYLRERHLTSKYDLKIDPTGRRMPYHLQYDEQFKTTEELKRLYSERSLPDDAWENPDYTKFDDVDLYQLGYWSFLNQVASREGFNFLYDSSPWRSHVSNGNAALLASLDTGYPDQYYTLDGGMDSLPKAMVREFLNASHTHALQLNQRLACIQDRRTYFGLIFIHTKTDSNDHTEDLKESRNVCARKVIVAVSPEGAKDIELLNFRENVPNVTEEISANIEPVPMMTAYFLYNQSWWVGATPEYPDVITDMPVRHVRYVGTGRLKTGNGTGTSGSTTKTPYGHLFMVAAPDGSDVSYFKTLINNGVQDDGKVRTNCNLSLQAVRDINRQIAKIHRVPDYRDIPLPIAVAVKDWSQAPSGGGWHMWRRGVRWSDVAKKMARPFAREHLFYVGSGFCPGSCQFWAEGALQTVDDVLERYFLNKDPDATEASTEADELVYVGISESLEGEDQGSYSKADQGDYTNGADHAEERTYYYGGY